MNENIRPMPPKGMLQLVPEHDFLPAPEIEEWLRAAFLDEGSALYNFEHRHLQEAHLGCLWASVPNMTKGREVVGTCESALMTGPAWKKARALAQLKSWFGGVPDFILTFSASFARGCSDAEWCALVEHEMYHAGQQLDEYGMPKFTKDGEPKFALRGHDVEEFIGVVRRYGTGATGANMRELIEVAGQKPEIAAIEIGAMCGTCLAH
jgi:hypothetical protein